MFHEISKHMCNWDTAIKFSFNDIDYYEKNVSKAEPQKDKL